MVECCTNYKLNQLNQYNTFYLSHLQHAACSAHLLLREKASSVWLNRIKQVKLGKPTQPSVTISLIWLKLDIGCLFVVVVVVCCHVFYYVLTLGPLKLVT